MEEEKKKAVSIHIHKLTPIQMPHVELEELKAGRAAFSQEEWIKVLLRSTGMEPDKLTDRERMLLLLRMLPLVENNLNLCELGPRSTGKSHLYKEISPNSILVSGGQTTVANLFYNMSKRTIGLVGLWDCVAFDELAGITFRDKDGVQIMKDYMASGCPGQGGEIRHRLHGLCGEHQPERGCPAANLQPFRPLPPGDGDGYRLSGPDALLHPRVGDPKIPPGPFYRRLRLHHRLPGRLLRELRKEQRGDAIGQYFRLGKNLNQRDTVAVRKLTGGFLKLLYPDNIYTKEQLEEVLRIALEMRCRVKEQLKKLGAWSFTT